MARGTLIALAALAAGCSGDAGPAAAAPAGASAPAGPGWRVGTDRPVAAFFDCLRTRGVSVVSAHRGGPSAGFAENAISTMDRILATAPAVMEIDVATTSDGVLVLMHDDDLDRTTSGTGPVRDRPFAYVETLVLEDANGRPTGQRVPTLNDALDWADGRTILQLDIKRSTRYADVARAVGERAAFDRVVFIAYTPAQAAAIARAAPDAFISVTIGEADDLEVLEQSGLAPSRLLAWTGADQPDFDLDARLADFGVETAFGTLGGRSSLDRRFAQEGDEGYRAIAGGGIELIATDRPMPAAAAIASDDDVRCGIAKTGG